MGLDKKELAELPKALPEKLVLAWWLRENTTVTLHWVAQRLEMSHYTRVTQAINRLSSQPGKKLEKMKRKLLTLTATQQPRRQSLLQAKPSRAAA